MERQILFRGKTQNKKWVYWNEYGELVGIGGKNRTRYEYHRTQNSTSYYYSVQSLKDSNLLIKYTVGQFTGLTDKNGKKIFENDILLKGLEKVVVKWNSNQCRWGIYSNGFEISGFNESTKNYFEVIGNIHDNTELLQGAKQ